MWDGYSFVYTLWFSNFICLCIHMHVQDNDVKYTDIVFIMHFVLLLLFFSFLSRLHNQLGLKLMTQR